MRKKLLIFLSALLLTGCAGSITEQKYEVVKPISKELTVADYFDEEARRRVVEFYDNENAVEILNSVGKELPDLTLVDYNGNEVSLNNYKGKKTVVEFVANWCSYCLEEEKEHIDNVVDILKEKDIEFIQVFVEGNKDEIDEFFKEAGKEGVRHTTITSSDEAYRFAESTGISGFPSFVVFDETGKCVWVNVGMVLSEDVDELISVAYNDDPLYNHAVTPGDVVTLDDLKAQLGEEKVDAINELSDTTSFEYVSYMNMGVPIELEGIIETIDGRELDFSKLKENVVFVFLLGYEGDEEYLASNENFVSEMNRWSEAKGDVDVVYLMMSYEGDANKFYESLKEKPIGYILDANSEDIPESLYQVRLYDAPSIVYYSSKDKVLTGGYAGENSAEQFEKAYNVFKEAYKISESK